uniref:Large ribosomal subunit protein uL4c n=1 Tax=Pleurocladia lacustris TaxID=246121 RepID=A0A1I9LVD9_9PHAE|nr:50S ribosomal protein L4 [Pleurocladia lacustris]ANS57559.1 50S ribosomal protein L4 [Pleurocladia lacustris]ANS57703.1 50S ribosomal protein L4 [Pleurocladia lacustris]
MITFLNFYKRLTEKSSSRKDKVLTFPIKFLTGENNKEIATLTLKVKEGQETDNYIIYRAYVAQRTNERQGTRNTLTRAEVRGGGRKPWRQKGTGKARSGSNRSPLWKGGGVSFGPKPKTYTNKINRKEWQLAIRALILLKEPIITVIDYDFSSLENKTNIFIQLFKVCNIGFSKNITIILPNIEDNLVKATRNIKTVTLMRADTLNLITLLGSDHLFISKDSLKIIEETYNG